MGTTTPDPSKGHGIPSAALPEDVSTGTIHPEEIQARSALKESQARNLAILSALPDLMFINTRDGVFLDYHAPDPGKLLLSPAVFLGRNTRDLFPPPLADTFLNAYGKAIDTGELQVLEYPLDLGGEPHHFEARIVAMDQHRALSIIRNVTERKQCEQKLAEETSRFRELADLLPETIYETDAAGRITFLSEAGLRTFGFGSKDLEAGIDILDIIAPQHRDALKRARRQVLASRSEVKLESQGLRKDGTQLPIIIHACAIVHEERNGTRGVIVDITERKRAEQILADTKAMLEAAFDQNPNPMVLVSVPDRVLRVINPPCLELFGIMDQLCAIGQPITDMAFTWEESTPDGKPIELSDSPLTLAIKGVKTYNREIHILRKDGTVRIAKVHGTPIYNAFGKHIAAMVILRDITESRRAKPS